VQGDDTHSRTFPGVVEATKNAELAFQVPGVIIEFPVKEGDKVAKGDVIARLRPDEFEARLKTLQGELDQARANLRALLAGQRPEEIMRLESQVRAADARLANAQIEYNRAARLLRTNAISKSDYDLAQTAYRVAQEEHESARQVLEKGSIAREEDIEAKEAAVRGLEGRVVEAKLRLDDTTLRAPYDGVIAQRFVEANQNVREKAPIVRFQDAQELDIVVDVPETVMANVRRSDIVETVAEFSSAPGLRFPLQIREVAQNADPATQTFKVRAAMRAPTEVNILPGMTAQVNLSYRRSSILGDRILVPVTSVFKDDSGKQVVWIVKEGVVSARPIKLGEAVGNELEIIEGVEPGEQIVVAGVTLIRDGMKVRDLGDQLGGGQ
jgi:RND family efflux transporter MFP subunit